MANRTDKEARSIHGTNPQNLVEYIIRQKIYDTVYWKQECFGLSAERLVDKTVELKYIGGMYGEPQKASEFICLLLKMLQIQPDKEIVVEFIKNDDFKYLRVLGAFYLRLVGRGLDVYQYLEPLLNDYRKVKVRLGTGQFVVTHIDELIDDMLRKDRLFSIALPRLPSRAMLERTGQLEPRVSVLDEEFDEAALEEEQEEAARAAAAAETAAAEQQQQQQQEQAAAEPEEPMEEGERRGEREKWQLTKEERRQRPRSRSRSRDRPRRERSRSRSRERRREHSRSRSRERPRERSRSRERRREPPLRERRERSRSRSRGRQERERSRERQPRDERYLRDERDRRDRPRDERERPREERDRRDHREREPERRDNPERRRRERSSSPGDKRHDKKARAEPAAAAGKGSGGDTEIYEANALRAKLGLKPLK